MNEIDKCTAMLNAWTRKLEEFRLGAWLRSEPSMLPRWKRKPHSFHSLPDGSTIACHLGPAHSVHEREPKTTYIRRDFNAGDVGYLQRVVMGSRLIMADEADTILRRLKPNTSRPKRRPMEADPDVPSLEWRARPERRLTTEQLIMESGLTGRALARELARIR